LVSCYPDHLDIPANGGTRLPWRRARNGGGSAPRWMRGGTHLGQQHVSGSPDGDPRFGA
jgi:hypothetical protein